MNQLTQTQLHILQHSLGLDQYGEYQGDTHGYRNYFTASAEHHDWPDLTALVQMGFMVKRDPCAVTDCWFSVTPQGRDAVKQESPQKPKISKSKARYRRYLDMGDSFDSFLAYCRWDAEPEHSWNQ